jgi:hypothetical protein
VEKHGSSLKKSKIQLIYDQLIPLHSKGQKELKAGS